MYNKIDNLYKLCKTRQSMALYHYLYDSYHVKKHHDEQGSLQWQGDHYEQHSVRQYYLQR